MRPPSERGVGPWFAFCPVASADGAGGGESYVLVVVVDDLWRRRCCVRLRAALSFAACGAEMMTVMVGPAVAGLLPEAGA